MGMKRLPPGLTAHHALSAFEVLGRPFETEGGYCSPEIRVIYFDIECPFFYSSGGQDDNEHTGEEDLF